MRWLSNLFGGNTVELEYPDNGKLVKKRVSRAQFDSMMCNAVAEGTTANRACLAHILDALHDERTEKWIVGEHVLAETYHRYEDSNGELYVMIYYENGEPQMEVLNKHNKQLWCQAASQFAAIGSANEEAYIDGPARPSGLGLGAQSASPLSCVHYEICRTQECHKSARA
jgi:hypothetical protein